MSSTLLRGKLFDLLQVEGITMFLLLPYHGQPGIHYASLSYDVAFSQWITSCHKNHMTTRVITLWRVDVTSLTMSVSTMCFLAEIMFILKAIKFHFKGSNDKQNLTLVVISYEIYETRRRLVSLISY